MVTGFIESKETVESNDLEKQKLLDLKKQQDEFLSRVETNLKRSEKDIWFIKNDDHPQKESLSKKSLK